MTITTVGLPILGELKKLDEAIDVSKKEVLSLEQLKELEDQDLKLLGDIVAVTEQARAKVENVKVDYFGEVISREEAKNLPKHNELLCRGLLSGKPIRTAELVYLPESLVGLLKTSSDQLNLDGLRTLKVSTAEKLVERNLPLSLSGLKEISPEVALALGKSKRRLRLKGLTTISVEVAQNLAQNRRKLELDGLADISAEIAIIFAQFKGELSLSGLKVIDPEVAEALASRKDNLSLVNLKELNEDTALELNKCQGSLDLSGLENISAGAAQVLAKRTGRLTLSKILLIRCPVAQCLKGRKNIQFIQLSNSQVLETLEKNSQEALKGES